MNHSCTWMLSTEISIRPPLAGTTIREVFSINEGERAAFERGPITLQSSWTLCKGEAGWWQLQQTLITAGSVSSVPGELEQFPGH